MLPCGFRFSPVRKTTFEKKKKTVHQNSNSDPTQPRPPGPSPHSKWQVEQGEGPGDEVVSLPCPRNASCKEHGSKLGDAGRVQFQALRDSL